MKAFYYDQPPPENPDDDWPVPIKKEIDIVFSVFEHDGKKYALQVIGGELRLMSNTPLIIRPLSEVVISISS